MPERWQHELRKLKNLDPPAGLWDQAMQGPRRPWRPPVRAHKTWPAIAAALAVAVVAAGTLGLVIAGKVTGSGPASAGPARHAGGLANPIGWNVNLYPLGPPGFAEKTTVAGAQAAVGFPVPLPSTAAASRASLTQAWVNTHHGEVALVFDKGKVDITMTRLPYQSALRYFHAFVAEKKKNGAPNAAIGQVNGRPALVTGRGAVNFWRNGILISIYSNTYGTDTLLAIAGSMQ